MRYDQDCLIDYDYKYMIDPIQAQTDILPFSG